MTTRPTERSRALTVDAAGAMSASPSIAAVVAAVKSGRTTTPLPPMTTTTTTAVAPPPVSTAFQLIVSGQIESINYPGVGNLYCRYSVTYGTDWRVLHGADAGLTQLAYRGSHHDAIVFNFPIDISFKSTNPFGWPRIVFSVYGLDALGRDVVRGYGSMYIPTRGGKFTRQVPLFRPLSSSLLQQFTAWLTGAPPEYFDAKFITQNDGREVTRVTSAGRIKVTLNVVTSGMKEHGYAEAASG
ncbi:hypothetical protein Poli38472_001408 [Pythium oligandrum]|uniref:B9 domain-containing protein 1 n=1 Tax=Pythium oligandrum TaxID=41045 RepID=A0A8K1CUS8_PYTOL|nr:hypothetical protein Poli38472_001408 [Pythium oligandrum]|eukprot:TMW69252.1 hypothetical protein Poli38472_001408 [Pythium oligandrum]